MIWQLLDDQTSILYTSTWGGVTGTLQDLKIFELILETFSVKKHQLDTVVECAKTWKFPLQDTQYELAYDGRVKSMRWAKSADGDGGCASESEPRKEGDDSSSIDESRDHDAQEEASPSNQEGLHDDQESKDINSQNGALDESWDAFESVEPSWHLKGDNGSDFSDSSPVYNRDDYADDWDAFPREPWMRTAHEFEVRIVRSRRRRAS